MTVFTLNPSQHQTPSDRLTVTFFVAFLLHGGAIFLLGFEYLPPKNVIAPMEIILVQSKTASAPQEATFLAQSNQEGGGDVEDKVTATTPETAPFPDDNPNVVSTIKPSLSAARTTTRTSELTVKMDDGMLMVNDSQKTADQPQNTGQAQQNTDQPSLDLQTLLNMSQHLTSIQATLDASYQAHEKRPRHRQLSPRTKEYAFARYMDAWQTRIEETGLLHFPDEIRRQHLSGYLIMDVGINADGTIYEINVLTPSRHSLLDDTAKRIARLAAPFIPFSANIRKEVDILHITRTWEFSGDAKLGIE